MLMRPSTSGTTGNGEAVKTRRVKPYDMSGAARLIKEICLGIEEERAEQKMNKVELERNVTRLKIDLLKEGKWMEALKVSQMVDINNLHAEVRVNLKEVVAERDRLGRHFMSKGFSENEVDAIWVDTYVEEEEGEEIEDLFVGIVDGLDGVSPQSELKDICLRVKDLEADLTKERDASTSLLSSQVELQALEKLEEGLNRSVAGLNNDIIKKMNNQEQVRTDLANNRSELERLKNRLVDKDNELKGAQDDLSGLEVAGYRDLN
ncbi:hypothetical protein GIB67_025859 [Kingdonia uniflora]|uniref:Uncharacterized protein n=1 Tax=Kingdonia uniflora TaxID=39325 RepID=A0A7J7MD81_9MAGN|nr:hypothetical protein GIB67_025859 [Kingdonia uniflora]